MKLLRDKLASYASSSFARRLINGTAWITIGTVIFHILNLAAMLIAARILGKEEYGKLIIIQSTLSTVGIFAGFGIGTTATRYIAELKQKDKRRLALILRLTERFVLAFSITAAIFLALTSNFIANRFFNDTNLVIPLTVAAATVLFSAFDGYQKSILVGFEAWKAFAVSSIISAISIIPITAILTYKFGLTGAAFALVANTAVQFGFSRYQSDIQLSLFKIDKHAQGFLKEWRIVRDFALPALLAGALVIPTHWLCQIMLADQYNGFSELAILGIAMQWFNVLIYLPSLAARVLLPMLTERYETGELRKSKRTLKLAVLANLILITPISLVIAIASPWLLTLYGTDFIDGWKTLSLISFISILFAGSAPIGQMMVAANKMWIGVVMNLCWALIYITLSYFFVRYGAFGIVFSMAIAYLAHSIWIGIYGFRSTTN